MSKAGIRFFCFSTCIAVGILFSHCFAQKKQDSSARLIDQRITYETPKAYEVMHIAMALMDTTIVSNEYNVYYGFVDSSTAYYREVIGYFKEFRNHKLIAALNKSISKKPAKYTTNLGLLYNSYFFEGNLKKAKRMPWVRRAGYSLFSVKRSLVADFAKVSNFENFYQQHQHYYIDMLNQVKQFADVEHQKAWLEQNFSLKYDRYNLVVSPLMNAAHFTTRFKFQGERKSIMWVSKPAAYSDTVGVGLKAGLYTSVVMTEIDHNYVNPVSDQFKKRLKVIMGGTNRNKWVKANFNSNAYKSGYKVFNEYMTHAVYLLYTAGKYTANDQAVLETLKIKAMENRRGFINFGNFYNELKRLHNVSIPHKPVEALYPSIMEWCMQQNAQ